MPSATITVDAALFDLDGTLILSTDAVVLAWTAFHKKHGIELRPEFFHETHGMRTKEAFEKYFPQIDDTDTIQSLLFDVSIAEEFGHLAKPVNGGSALVNSMPQNRWCIVTSGTRGIAHAWFRKVLLDYGLPKPEVFLTSNDVEKGKPHPEPYLKGAELLLKDSVAPGSRRTVVFEDAPNGIVAGVSSGSAVIGIMTTFDADTLYKAGVSYAVKDLSHVKVVKINDDDSFELEIDYVEKS